MGKCPNTSSDLTIPIMTDKVVSLFNSVKKAKKVTTTLVCEMVRNDPKTGEEMTTIAWFKSDTHTLINRDDTEETYDDMKEKMLESLAKFQKRVSGWRFLKINMLDIYIGEFQPRKEKDVHRFPKNLNTRKHSST
jgi:hypothetical protein